VTNRDDFPTADNETEWVKRSIPAHPTAAKQAKNKLAASVAQLTRLRQEKEPMPEPWRLFTRAEAAKFLTERGFTTAKTTLDTLAVRGGGPPFVYWGRKPLYSPLALLEWAAARLSAPVASTSESANTMT
jgi:hypothetical protein